MARKPTISDSARRLLQNNRRALQRSAATAAEERLDRARREMQTAQRRIQQSVAANNENALLTGIRSIVTTVASSYGLLPPITIRSHHRDVEAFTDFESVSIRYPERLVPRDELGAWSPDVLRNLYADLKGISYHEIGHIMFSVPFPHLVEMAKNEGMDLTGYDLNSLHSWWNLMEDQRMEAAMVRESPIMADYFTTMVLTHILNREALDANPQPGTWLLVAGRHYLPRSIRAGYQKTYEASYGHDDVVRINSIIRRYMRATSASDMLKEVVNLYAHMVTTNTIRCPHGIDQHSAQNKPTTGDSINRALRAIARSADTTENESDDEAQPAPSTDSPSADDAQKSEGSDDEQDETTSDSGSSQGQGGEEQPTATDNGDQEGAPGSGETNKESPGDQPTGTPESAGNGEPQGRDLRREVQQVLEEMREHRNSDTSLDEAIRATYESAHTTDLALPRCQRMLEATDPVVVSQAESLATALADALSAYTAENAPLWQARQSRGVIDPFAYRTRQSGSIEYRRLYESGDIGTDIGVVLMLDTSGSMQGTGVPLGVAAYATKKACDSIEVPCTVMTFDYDSRIVWTESETPEPIEMRPDGGTNPEGGFMVLGEFAADRDTQLVVVMTDGMFGSGVTLAPYQRPGRYFLGIGYGYDTSKEYLDRIGFHESHIVQDVLAIPQIVSNFLAAYIR